VLPCTAVLQYTARLNADKLKNYIHRLNEGKIGKQFFNMRLCPEDVSDSLSGYEHNAVSPIGIKTPLPIIMSHEIAQLQPDFFFLGAGEVDLKVGFSAAEFVEKYQPMVVDCTY
jgi:prolyl-tRNA editing enzyme YbaK/EbsC (Cys-tRNA(Pro) deacylase)